MYKIYFKRLFDFTFALIGFIIISPIFILITLLLTIANKEIPFFIQTRPGKNEKLFRIIKFKTMNEKRDINGVLLSDADRLTQTGKFVRKTSLDEIPQLLNVIKGDMSLIGPRPLLVEYLPLYDNKQKRRHDVRPGITGWAQVNGRNSISWTEKFDLDIWYIDHLSLHIDLKILWLTLYKVFKKEGINQSDQTTMEKFSMKN